MTTTELAERMYYIRQLSFGLAAVAQQETRDALNLAEAAVCIHDLAEPSCNFERTRATARRLLTRFGRHDAARYPLTKL